MKKIFNWTFGSVFRTFGRIIAYLLIALLFGFIVSKFDIKIIDLLPIMKVNAATISTSSDQYLVQTCDFISNCDYTIGGSTWNSGYINRNTQVQNNHGVGLVSQQYITTVRFRQQFNSSNYLQSGVTYIIRYKINYTYKAYDWFKPNQKWSFILGVQDTSGNNFDISSNNFNVIVSNISNDNYGMYVTLTFTPTTTLKQIAFQIRFPYTQTNYVPVTDDYARPYGENWEAINYKTLSITSDENNNTTDAINNQTIIIENQTNMINDNINELQDALLEDNINDSEVEDSLQFDNITENSLGPFATFLTLPLTWVQNILASGQTCSDINLPLPYMSNKYLTLPCMSGFWSNMGALGVLIQACWLAVVGVRIFNGLFLLTVDTISSKDNEDELTKIKSWEL